MGLWLIFQTGSLVIKIGLALLQVTFFRYIAWSTISLISLEKTTDKDDFTPIPSAYPKLKRERLTNYANILSKRFNKEKLRTLCFALGVDYEDLPAEGKENKARELVKYCERREYQRTYRSNKTRTSRYTIQCRYLN